METQLVNFFYELVEKNKEFLDLKKYDIDHSMNFDEFDEFIELNPHLKERLEIIKTFYSHTLYVSCQDFIDILNKNIDEIVSDYNDFYHILVVPQNLNSQKSNFYFILYFLHNYKIKTNNTIKYIFTDIDTAIAYNLPNDKKLLIFCDDFVYSGRQLGSELNKSIAYDNIIKKKYEVKIYLNIVGITQKAKFLLLSSSVTENDLIFSKNCIQSTPSFLNTMLDMSKINFNDYGIDFDTKIKKLHKYIYDVDFLSIIFNSNAITIDSIFQKIKNKMFDSDVSMVYLFSKYPDVISSAELLCAFTPNEYILNLSKLNEHIIMQQN